jgi:Cu+-exporting ATPase
MNQQVSVQQIYTCPMHSDVRQQGPGTCPKCRMALVPEGTRFGIFRHMMSSPLHLLVMAALMIAVMAIAMMVMR